MAKKDFTQVNTGRVYNAIAEATQEPQQIGRGMSHRKEYTPEEALAFMQEMKTTGRKGVKLPRINLAFAPDVYEYIQTMSRVRGETLTAFVNLAIREHMQEHADIYEKAIEFKNSL